MIHPVLSKDEISELAKEFSVNNILKHHAYQSKPLGFQEAYLLGVFSIYGYNPTQFPDTFQMDPTIVEKQSIAALCALHNSHLYTQKNAAAQIAGITAAVFDYDIRVSKNGFLNPNVEFCMDNCGMGGDLFRTPNVSTISALIAASQGIPFCKHGSPGNTDSTGSSDFMKHCGVNLFSDKANVEQAVELFNFGYTDAVDTGYKLIHVQTHKSAQLAHMNDIIGPITNPIIPEIMTKRIVGVNHLILPEVIAEAYQILNQKGVTNLQHGLFVRGFVDQKRNGGIDEISVFPGGSIVSELKQGEISSYELTAEDFGLPTADYFEVPSGKYGKAQFGKQILVGEITGAPRDLILANASIIFYLQGHSLEEGTNIARNALESGAPLRNLEEFVKFNSR
jgi:anthranilate phosphoribosyltransferase